MADFYQNGIITTLHNLSRRPTRELEAELIAFSRRRPLGLLLPALYSEFESDALPKILEHLAAVPYLSQIVIGLDRADREQFGAAYRACASLPQDLRILWNDGPRLQALDQELKALDLSPRELGKGRNVWYCMGYILATGRAESIALHDCDITTYDRDLLARLIYPVAHPQFNYEFCKGFYARVAGGRINGRVSRLLVTPLLRALKKTVGEVEYLAYMDSFRYPLAGEFSFRRDVLRDLRIPSDWGLEIGVLSEMYRNYSNNRLCQVDIADSYDHKHQALSANNDSNGLSRMSIDICKALFRKLATRGVVLSPETFRSVKATYYRIALDFVETYNADALMNGMEFDIHQEEKAVELFADNIMKAGEAFIARPKERPFIPSWSRVSSAMPDVLDRLCEAVELDHREVCSH
jgi:glucosyl-3-phosphoglycerate synthase